MKDFNQLTKEEQSQRIKEACKKQGQRLKKENWIDPVFNTLENNK